MNDKTIKILLAIIALNLTVQTLKDVEIFPTAYAQSRPQKVTLCDPTGIACGDSWIQYVRER